MLTTKRVQAAARSPTRCCPTNRSTRRRPQAPRQGPEPLGDAEREHERRSQDRGERHPAHEQADPGQEHHAPVTMMPSATPRMARAASRAECQPRGPASPAREATDAVGRPLTRGIQETLPQDDQEKLRQHHSDRADRAETTPEDPGIGRQALRSLASAGMARRLPSIDRTGASRKPDTGSPSQPGGDGTGPGNRPLTKRSSEEARETESAAETSKPSSNPTVITATAIPRRPHSADCTRTISGHVATTIMVAQISADKRCRRAQQDPEARDDHSPDEQHSQRRAGQVPLDRGFHRARR